jgi:hypothetical protein
MTPCTNTVVGLVESLWAQKRAHCTDYFVKVQGFTLGEIDPAYQMRSISKTNHHAVIHIEVRVFPPIGMFKTALTGAKRPQSNFRRLQGQ